MPSRTRFSSASITAGGDWKSHVRDPEGIEFGAAVPFVGASAAAWVDGIELGHRAGRERIPGRMSNHVPGDAVLCGAAGALDGDFGIGLEEFLRIIPPGAEDGEDTLEVAAAMESELAGFEEFGLFVLIDLGDGLGVESVEPFLIEIRLGGEEDEVFVGEAEGASGSLFGLFVEGLDPLERIIAPDLDAGEAGLGAVDGGLGVEEVSVGFADVFGEAASGDLFLLGGTGDEEIYAGSAEVDGPGDRFGPRSGHEVEGEGREEVLQHCVERLRVLQAVLHEVQVVVGVDPGEVAADHEDVAVANEDRFDVGEVFRWFGFHDWGRFLLRGRGGGGAWNFCW